MPQNNQSRFKGLMMEKQEKDHQKKNPNEGMSKISFRIPTSGLNVLDYMAKTLDTTRQDILNEILREEIKEAYTGMTQHLQMEPKEWGLHFESVCKGELEIEHHDFNNEKYLEDCKAGVVPPILWEEGKNA